MEASQPGSIGLRLVLLVVLVVANAFFVAAEFALVSARRTRIEAMVRQGDRRAKAVQAAQQDLYRQLSAAQLGITVASILLGFVAEDTVAFFLRDWLAALPSWLSFLARAGVASTIAISLISFLHVVFGEQAPKALAITYPEAVSRWVAAPLILFSWITRPLTGLLNSSANWLIRLMGIKDAASELERIHSPEEIRMLVEQSEEGGGLQQQDARLLEGVFEFSEKTAQEVMTPRTQMAALEADLTVEEAADQVAIHGRSRYPAYTESLDDIIGVVHSKDILAALRARPGQTIRVIMRPPLFVPGTREVEDVLADMKRLKNHLAIVLDEYGGTAGLVTMEDLLEEIVGPIYDEHDPQDRSRPDEGGPRLDGSMPISEFNTEYGATLDDTDYTTIGGYIFGQLGRLPRVGDQVTVGPFTFEVIEMDGRRVKTIRLHIARSENAPSAESAATAKRA
ncbi:MAG TPA: hemolysin family protein [Gemmatimonadales bacterium]|nr:hemolysin family protein [Gemmatimonadales bacterium]